MKRSGRELDRPVVNPAARPLVPSRPLSSCGSPWGGAQSEFEARADGVRDERLAKASAHRVLGPPPGAVGRDDDTRSKGAKVIEDLRDEGLEDRSVEMESAHDRVEGALFGQAAS